MPLPTAAELEARAMAMANRCRTGCKQQIKAAYNQHDELISLEAEPAPDGLAVVIGSRNGLPLVRVDEQLPLILGEVERWALHQCAGRP